VNMPITPPPMTTRSNTSLDGAVVIGFVLQGRAVGMNGPVKMHGTGAGQHAPAADARQLGKNLQSPQPTKLIPRTSHRPTHGRGRPTTIKR